MKEQSKIFEYAVLIAILSLILTIVIEWEFDRLFYKGLYIILTGHREFVVNIGLGVFTGAGLSAGMAYISYQYQKQKYIDDCCEYLGAFLQKLSKLKYLHLVIDVNLLCHFYNAKESKLDSNLTDEINGEIKKWYKANYPDASPEFLRFKDFEHAKEISEVIVSYYEFLQFDILKADTLLAERDPHFKKAAENSEIENALNHIKTLYETVNECLDYMKQFSSMANQLKVIDKLQKDIFEKVKYIGSTTLLPPQNKEFQIIETMQAQIKSGKKEKVKEENGSSTGNV